MILVLLPHEHLLPLFFLWVSIIISSFLLKSRFSISIRMSFSLVLLSTVDWVFFLPRASYLTFSPETSHLVFYSFLGFRNCVKFCFCPPLYIDLIVFSFHCFGIFLSSSTLLNMLVRLFIIYHGLLVSNLLPMQFYFLVFWFIFYQIGLTI